MNTMTRRMASATAAALLFAASSAVAQAPDVVRVRATIEKVDGATLDVKTRDGAAYKIRLADNAPVNQIVKAALSDIKEGSYIAVTAMPQPDGSQKATAIYIFPPNVHPGEGFGPWDFAPGSTMTNATVANQVTGTDGQTLTVKYKDGEKKVIVPSNAEITTAQKGSAGDLKAGQKIFIFAAKKQPDGTLQAPNVSFGDYGVWR
jgi:outer membrane lipoprotein SlyB